jgi:3'(2'), 5'-bisphosphate nucleotidase/myo-inositol-1(or 4)-monophosphatase
MNLNKSDLLALCDIAIKAAKQAGMMIQQYAGREFAIKDKVAGSSPASQIVTEVDWKSQEMILEYIQPTCEAYDLGMLIEESDDDLSRIEKDYFWCVDPLDGTLPFVEQREGYAVSIALVSSEGQSYLGVIYDPLTQTLYHAIKGVGAFRNEERWHWESNFDGSYETIESGGAVMNACWVLDRAPAGFIKKPKSQEGGGCLWDYSATACLYEELGAVVSDSVGNRLDLNSPISLFMNRKGVLYASHCEISERLQNSV